MSEGVTLEVGDSAYPGRLNIPDEPSDCGVLVIPGAGHGPFGDVFLRFGREAAEAGYHVARFETWMTPEDLDAKTDANFRAEIDAGVDFLRSRGCETVAIVAKSFGGRLALEHRLDGVDRLVLWAPAVLAEGVSDVPEDMREQVPSVSAAELQSTEIPVRILQGDEDHFPVESAARIAEGLPQGELVTLPGEDHSSLRDHERVIEETIAFLPE